MVTVLFAASTTKSPSGFPPSAVANDALAFTVIVLPDMLIKTKLLPDDVPSAAHTGMLNSVADVQNEKQPSPIDVADGKSNVVADVQLSNAAVPIDVADGKSNVVAPKQDKKHWSLTEVNDGKSKTATDEH